MKLKRLLFVIIIASSLQNSHAQNHTILRDTSFTIQKTYNKEKKKFPNIRLAQASDSALNISLNIVYKTIKKRQLTVDIFEPVQNKNNIPILLIHGGGWRSGDKTHLHTIGKTLAQKGYSCFALEYRLSLEASYPGGINDIQDAIIWLKNNATKYSIEPQKIIVLGTSSGGQMAALIGSKNQPTIYAVINIDGLLAFHHADSEEGEMAAQWLNGTYEENSHNWKDASAITHINPNSAPILFINSSLKRFSAGKNDVIKKYQNLNIPYDTLTFDNSPHTFWYFHPWFTPMIDRIDHFIQTLNKGVQPNY